MGNIKQEIIDFSIELEIDKIGFAKVDSLEFESEISLQSFKKGYFANKDYLIKNIKEKSNPKLLLENAKSVIAIAVNYNTSFLHSDNQTGKISRHAWGDDYHQIVKNKSNEIANFLKTNYSANCFISVDGGKVFEKIWAERCSIGWIGKNSLIISPEFGSWIFLGIIFTSLVIEPDPPHKNLCGACQKCINSCPNQAIVSDKIIDIRKCIAFLNIEDKKSEYININTNLSGYIYGCDICQNVCPYNKNRPISKIKEFTPRNNDISLKNDYLQNLDKEQFDKRFNNSSIKRIGLDKIKSNTSYL